MLLFHTYCMIANIIFYKYIQLIQFKVLNYYFLSRHAAPIAVVAQQLNAGLAIERARVRIPLCYRFEDWAFLFSPLTP